MAVGEEKKRKKNQTAETPDKKTLWVITELYYPENNQTGYYMTGIAEGLADDFDVKVICGQPNYAARGTLAPKKEIYKNVEIRRVWGTTLDKNVLLYRLINMATLGMSIFLKTLTGIKKNDAVLVVSAPPTLPFITAGAALIRRSKYTLIIQDKYPETLTAVGKIKENSNFVKVLDWLNRRLYGNAEKIIVVGRDMRELIEAQLNQTEQTSQTKNTKNNGKSDKKIPIDVIQNWASLEEIKPLPRSENKLLRELNLIDKFVFLYAGNMGYPQDIESIVACAEKLKADKRFHFLFIGSGVKRRWLLEKAETGKLENVTILPPRPRSEQNLFLNACDVGFVSLVKKMRGVAMPSRTYNLMAAAKPILALTEKNSEVARVLEEHNVGWYVEPNEPERLLEMIYKIYAERAKIPAMQKKSRQTALEEYSVEKAIEKYKKSLADASDNDLANITSEF
ncbi:MAG: glycosyltransferase family 4 protein [Acidobacteriota bacterium]|nr:glycosyltransferase family 4 protein [Acidobacteriota bacterium]